MSTIDRRLVVLQEHDSNSVVVAFKSSTSDGGADSNDMQEDTFYNQTAPESYNLLQDNMNDYRQSNM